MSPSAAGLGLCQRLSDAGSVACLAGAELVCSAAGRATVARGGLRLRGMPGEEAAAGQGLRGDHEVRPQGLNLHPVGELQAALAY